MSLARLQQILLSPVYAAIAAASITLLVMFIDHKINKIEDKTSEYVKVMLYVGILVFGIVYITTGSYTGSVKSQSKNAFSILNEPF